MTHIICFGDSITRGENDHENGGWVDLLKAHCIAKFLETKDNEICVFNLGIGGETTQGLKKRFVNEFSSRLIEGGHNIVTFAYGANDIAIRKTKNTVSLEKYYSNLIFCIDFAQKKNAEVYLINILPVLEKVNRQPKPNDYEKIRRTADIIKYNQTLLKISEEKNIHHIDVFETFELEQDSLFTYDGVHPNSKGHQRVYKKIKQVILDS